MNDIVSDIINDLNRLSQDNKVVPLGAIEQSESLLKRMAEEQDDEELQTLLEELDPSFVIYMNMIECLMIISTIVKKHPRLQNYNKRIDAAESSFGPGSWESTVTDSFFNMWLLFDVPVEGSLSLAEVCLKTAQSICPINSKLENLIKKAIASRNGLYKVIESNENHVYFEELITGEKITANCPTGYMGQPGEIWLVRIFAPIDNESFATIVTTPYCICNTDDQDWLNYFAHQGLKPEMIQPLEAMDRFIRKTSASEYWLNYIHSTPPTLETNECIHISGIPD